MASQNTLSSTQKFTEIADVFDTIVLFTNNTAALVIDVASTNFTLLSGEEQDAKVAAYAAFLNSLSFPIQILVVNKRIDISSYITRLENAIPEQESQLKKDYMANYKNFVQELVKQKTVLDKNFYIIIPESSLEIGATSAIAGDLTEFAHAAQLALKTKADSLLSQLRRIGLLARTLEKDELIRLFKSMYNQTDAVEEDKQQ